MEEFLDNPTASANHMVLGMNMDQRKQARATDENDSVYTWV